MNNIRFKREFGPSVFGRVSLAISIILVGSSAYAADDATVAAAKKEGSVVVYSAAPAEMLDQLTKGFNAKYPDIKAQYYRAGSAQVFQRLEAEIAADRVNGDIIHVSDPATITDLKRADKLQAYESPEYKAYDSKYIDPDFTWFVARAHFTNIGYNPNVVPEDQAPKTLKDLADPRFKGKVGIGDVRNAGGTYYWQYSTWKLYGPEYFQAIFDNDPKMYSGHGPINDRIITGELAVGVDLSYLTDEAIEKGAPIKAVFPADGAPMIWSPVGIVKKAPHPNAAKLMMDFIASKEGQIIFNSQYSYSLRPDVEVRKGMTPLKDIKVLELSLDDMIAKQDEVQAAVRKPWGY